MPRLKRDSGQAIVLVALGMVVVMGFTGLGFDLGYLRYMKRQVQKAADAAALAGATEVSHCGGISNCSAVTAAAQSALTENGFPSSTLVTACGTSAANLTITVNNPPCSLGASDPHNGSASYVEAVVARKTPLLFARIVGISSVTITARGEAGFTTSTADCVYTLDPTMTGAISVTGASNLRLPGCGLVVNSNSNQAVQVQGSSTITATEVDIVGKAALTGTSTITPAPVTGVAPATDPLAYIPKPSYTPCTTSTAQLVIGGVAHQTITPGNYCGGISIGASSVVTFNPGNYVVANGIQIGGAAIVTMGAGTYVMQGGGYVVGGSGVVTGSNLTFYLTGNSTFPYGPLSLTGAANVQLVAPTSGTYVGMLFYQDSSAYGATVPTGGNTSVFAGSASSYLQGSLYFPTTALNYSGGTAAQYTIIDADSLSLSGSALINSDYSSLAGGSPVHGSGSRGILVE